MGGSQGGSQGAAGKVIHADVGSFPLPLADLPSRERMAKTHSDLLP